MTNMRTYDELARTLRMAPDGASIALTQEELSYLLFGMQIPPTERPSTPEEAALNTQVGGSHYRKMRIQPIEYCEANELGACESAIVKYISRWESKGGLQDLEKIKHYVDLLIETREKYPRDMNQSASNQSAANELSR